MVKKKKSEDIWDKFSDIMESVGDYVSDKTESILSNVGDYSYNTSTIVQDNKKIVFKSNNKKFIITVDGVEYGPKEKK